MEEELILHTYYYTELLAFDDEEERTHLFEAYAPAYLDNPENDTFTMKKMSDLAKFIYDEEDTCYNIVTDIRNRCIKFTMESINTRYLKRYV